MKSGLDGRNNRNAFVRSAFFARCLNEVRPRWPEQWVGDHLGVSVGLLISMKSGLDGRNNALEQQCLLVPKSQVSQ